MIEIITKSFFMVALTEIGDKTQLLAFLLVAKYRKPWTILLGITIATILNHLFAAAVGSWVGSHFFETAYFKWGMAIIFVAFAIWVLIPDKDDNLEQKGTQRGALLATIISFFIAEMGDKTQLSTVALAAQYKNIYWVTIGTTLGMIFADGLAVFLGNRFQKFIPMHLVRYFAALFALFLAIAVFWS